jgi:hypothetical protein
MYKKLHIDLYFIIWYKRIELKQTLNLTSFTMKKIDSATPTLKTNNTLRWVLRIVACLGYGFFVIGVIHGYSNIVWYGIGITLFLIVFILGGILVRNESRLHEYATNTTMTFLPKPAYVPGFWRNRQNALISIWSSLVFLAMGFIVYKVVAFAIACVLLSSVFLVLHIVWHPKRVSAHSSSGII